MDGKKIKKYVADQLQTTFKTFANGLIRYARNIYFFFWIGMWIVATSIQTLKILYENKWLVC